nr:MAG TPA: hypothetical protein [Caudoviricetes sp.]
MQSVLTPRKNCNLSSALSTASLWAVESIIRLWCYHEQQTQKSNRS